MAFPPSDYIGPDDARERDDLLTLQPANALRLRFVHGYTTRKGSRSNLFYNKQGMLVYHAAALGIVYDKKNHQQWFFRGHDDDITALDLSPKDRQTVVTGQMGKDPKILVWTSKPQGDTRTLQQLCVIHGDHKRAIIGLSFNSTGEYIASMGYDNNRSIAIYKWKKDQSLEKMRIGVDKGHSDDVYQLAYNPVTDHIVAGGKKFLRFFGLKEGALDDPEAAARAAAKAGG
jgi:microtubule-associated protein-like 6